MNDEHEVAIAITTLPAPTLDGVFDVLITGARANGARMTEPDDDWAPLYLVAVEHKNALMLMSAMRKHDMVRAVAAIARQLRATMVGQVHSSWMVGSPDVGFDRMRELERTIRARGGSTEGIEGRREVLMIVGHTAQRSEARLANIERHDDAPPTLGDFLVFGSSGPGEGLTGAMYDPIADALRGR